MNYFRQCRCAFLCLLFTSFPAFSGPLELLKGQLCPAENALSCQHLRTEIQEIWEKIARKPAASERDHLRLQLNHALETHRLLSLAGTEIEREALDQKYAALQTIMDVREHETPDLAYHHLEMKAVQEVMERFGPLEIDPTSISPRDQQLWQSREVAPPWAGYWYPRYDPILYAGDQSVFAKVDRMMARIGRDSKAQELEASQSIGYPDSWEGLCNAWSIASILEPEPQAAADVLGERLSISDQKALLTKLHEGFPVRIHGLRYDGDELTDGTYQDIRPEAFHRLAVSVLGDFKRPFIIDDTAGTEVWQQPVWKVDWTLAEDGERPDAYRVSMRVWKIKMRTRATDELTNRNDFAFELYQYRLFVDPELKAREGRLLVIAGEWLGSSRRNHPDYVVMPEDNGWPASFNAWLQSNRDPLLALLRHPAQFDRPE